MPRSVVLASMTYRHYTPEWVVGTLDAMKPSEEDAAALRELDVDMKVIVSSGYGGGRNAGNILEQCLARGVELVLFAEFDIRYTAGHVVKILQAHRFLTERFGQCAVGAIYPTSSDPLLHLLHIDGRDAFYDCRKPVDRKVLRQAVRNAQTAAADDLDRYVEVWQLPFGFTLFPVEAFRDAPPISEVGGFRLESHGFDQGVSQYLKSSGRKMFADLALDVGHLSARPLSTLQTLELEA